MKGRIEWPDSHDFAFTIFDDTDFSVLPDIKEVYRFLADLGIYTTKSVWPIRGKIEPYVGGSDCEDPNYLDWVRELQAEGFEIGLHNAAYSTSQRADTVRGFDRFKEIFGHDPHTLANHAGNDESIYWGNCRLTGVHQTIFNVLTRNTRKNCFEGHLENSPLFWGDLCQTRVRYVRNFVYPEINTLKVCPYMPYYDPARPYVKAWFASTEGPRAPLLAKTLAQRNLDRLAAENGACIVYAHLGQDCWKDGAIHPGFKDAMTRLSKMNGWFVPLHRLLDYLVEVKGLHTLTAGERAGLERRWLWDKVRTLGAG